jgi:hypothetical protein
MKHFVQPKITSIFRPVVRVIPFSSSMIVDVDDDGCNDEKKEKEKEIISSLSNVLYQSKLQHHVEIMKQPDLKHAHIYCKIHHLSGQLAGPLLERYIKKQFRMTRNNPADCIGDVRHNDIDFEIKTSIGGQKNNTFNYVQLRLNHTCSYLLTAYYINETNLDNLGELFLFRLNKPQMKSLILKHGGYAHGTVQKLGTITDASLEIDNNNNEYAIRPIYMDKCWCDLMQYRISEDEL